jgi:hypothetical protein
MDVGDPSSVVDGFDLLMNPQHRKRMASSSDAGSAASSKGGRLRDRKIAPPAPHAPPAPPALGNAPPSLGNALPAPSPSKGYGYGKSASVAASVSTESSVDEDDDASSIGSFSSKGSDASTDSSSESQSDVARRRSRGGGRHSDGAPNPSPEQIVKEKREILYQLGRIEAKGLPVSKRFSMSDPIEEMRAELERLKLDREVDMSVRFQKRVLMTCVNGIELMNRTFDPFGVQLDGWSDSMHDGMVDYDEVLEDLHIKYRSRGIAMAPELKLMFMVGGSGVMFHMTSSMFKKANLPGVEQVLRQNPGLMQQFQQATVNTMAGGAAGGAAGGGGEGRGGYVPTTTAQPPPPPPTASSPPGGNILGSLFGNLFGGGGGGAMPPMPPMPPPPAPPQPSTGARAGGREGGVMRGPKPVHDMLRDIQMSAFSGSGGGGTSASLGQRTSVGIIDSDDDADDMLMDDDRVSDFVYRAPTAPAAVAAAPPPALAAPAAAPRGRKPAAGRVAASAASAASASGPKRNTVTVGM